MKALRRRIFNLEHKAEAQAPVQPIVCILVDLDGFCWVAGQSYPTVEDAKAAHPSPGGEHIIVRTVDCRRPV